MKVYVVMGNDYPSAVFADEGDAKAACQRLMDEQREKHEAEDKRFGKKTHYTPRIFWRHYGFDLQPASGQEQAEKAA